MIIPEIYPVASYSDEVARAIGNLGPDLSSRSDGQPAEKDRLEMIVASPAHDLLVAELRGQIVGAAAVSLIVGWTQGNNKGWLEDFVASADESVRGHGVGYNLFWRGVVGWCRDKQAKQLLFTSNRSREAAHKFYYRQGCSNPETTLFAHDLAIPIK